MKYTGIAVYPIKFSIDIPYEVVDMSIEDLRQVIKSQVDDFAQSDNWIPILKIIQCNEPLIVETVT